MGEGPSHLGPTQRTNYRQLKNAQGGRIILLQRRADQLVSPENIHRSDIQIEQVYITSVYININVYICMCCYMHVYAYNSNY